MAITCLNLHQSLQEYLSRQYQCQEDGSYLAVATPYLYGHSEPIHVYLRDLEPNLIRLTDLGRTSLALSILSDEPLLATHRSEVAIVANVYGVQVAQTSEAVFVDLAPSRIAEGVESVAQACKELYSLRHLAPPLRYTKAQTHAERDSFASRVIQEIRDVYPGIGVTDFRRVWQDVDFRADLYVPASDTFLQTISTHNPHKIIKTTAAFRHLQQDDAESNRLVMFDEEPDSAAASILYPYSTQILTRGMFTSADEMTQFYRERLGPFARVA
jgi:hypothetical protein